MRSWWILSCVNLYAVAVSCGFYVQNGTIWEPEWKGVLATPPIQFSPSQNTVQLETDMLKDGDKAWIGYAMEYVEFQYTGCALLPTRNHKKANTSLDLGQCYFACKGSTLFGLTKGGKSCRCLTAEILKEDLTQKDCATVCDNKSFLCGSTTSMSIYKRVFTELDTGKEKDIIHQCLSYIEVKPPKTKYFSWKACSEKMKAMCISDIGDQHKYKPKRKWSNSIKACFKAGKYPMPYENITGSDKDVWLGVILTIAMTEYKAAAPEDKAKYLTYGYVERKNDQYLLNFTKRPSSINKTICKTDSGSTTATTTNPTSSSDIMAESVTSMSTTTQSNVGVFVGVPVAILVLIGIICAVILLWRRRKQSKDAAASSKTHHNGAYIGDSSRIILGNIVSDKREVDPQTTSLQQNVYDYISDVRADDNHQTANLNTFVVIEDVRCDNQTPGVTETAVTSENHGDHTYVVLEKAEQQPHYTDTPSIHPAHEDATNNSVNHVYNTAGYSALNSDKGVYDHIGGDKGRSGEDTSHYDTTTSDKQTDGTYDTTSPTKQYDEAYDTTSTAKQTEDTYNTTTHTKQTDETYNTITNPTISKHNTDGVYSVADHNGGNLYSQVNNGRKTDK